MRPTFVLPPQLRPIICEGWMNKGLLGSHGEAAQARVVISMKCASFLRGPKNPKDHDGMSSFWIRVR